MTNVFHPSDSAPTVAISVAIPAYGHAASLRQSLERIAACSPRPTEVLIHADGGWQVPAEILANLPFAVRVLSSTQRLGPGGGRHLLMQAATEDLVASFDDDSWPLDSDYFAKAWALMQAFPNVAVLSPTVYLREKPPLEPLPETTLERSFEGSASITRRSHYLQLPGYVPVPEAYGVEEADLSLQVHAAGFEILSSPWLRAWHERPQADNRHTILPWIQNELLLAYLRFPIALQPLGWLRALRHVWRHRSDLGWGLLVRTFAQGFPEALRYEAQRRRYSWNEVWRHHRTQSRRFHLKPVPSSGGLTVQATPCGPARKILYLQYTNPGGYPPLEHSSQILAKRGWRVRFLGLRKSRTLNLQLAPHLRIEAREVPECQPGVLQKLHYLHFAALSLIETWIWKPEWIYASDPLSTPIVRLCSAVFGTKVVYHEHDSPPEIQNSLWAKWVLHQRSRVILKADCLVIPSHERLNAVLSNVARSKPSVVVWNTPTLSEVRREKRPRSSPGLKVLFHGSIVPERFPEAYVDMLLQCPAEISISLAGYEPQGAVGYKEKLRLRAKALGLGDRFHCLPTVPTRHELLAVCAKHDVGLCLLQHRPWDVNSVCMAGASNKAFDYLSQGLAIVVPNEPAWTRLYLETGCGIACNPNDGSAIAKALTHLLKEGDSVWQMGEAGRQLCLSKWNYEWCFSPVLSILENEETSHTGNPTIIRPSNPVIQL